MLWEIIEHHIYIRQTKLQQLNPSVQVMYNVLDGMDTSQ